MTLLAGSVVRRLPCFCASSSIDSHDYMVVVGLDPAIRAMTVTLRMAGSSQVKPGHDGLTGLMG
jgi:hypothetical protein